MTECFIKAFGDSIYTRINLESGIPLPITYNILDIREPDANISHWSKTLKIPGTKTNNQLFQHIFEIGIDGGFNPNKKADVYFLQDTLEVLRGVLQLKKITRSQGLDLIYYECNAYGGSDDLFSKIADKKLTELDFSTYDHDYTKANQVTSWSQTPGSGYVYPMIDYRGHESAGTTWYVDDFFPALFAKEYVDKIFEYAGKKYTSTFLTSNFFKRLIIPYNRSSEGWFSNDDVEDREFRAERTTVQEGEIASISGVEDWVRFDDDSTGLNYDPSGLFNTTPGFEKWTVATGQTGWYQITGVADVEYRLGVTSGSFTADTDNELTGRLLIKVNGIVKQSGAILTTLPAGTYANNTIVVSGRVTVSHEKIFLVEGDEVQIYYLFQKFGNTSGLAPKVYGRVKSGAYFQNTFINILSEGSDLEVNNSIPQDVQMRDFLLSLINMFRLYVEEDSDNPNTYIIEPRDDYYTSTVIDWSEKLDYEKGLEIIPMAELQGRRYIFRYKEDKDYWNTDYQNKYKIDAKSETYGQKLVDVDNDFVTNDVTIQPLFSGTPMRGFDYHTRVVPVMYGGDINEPKPISVNPRILYWAGLKSFTGDLWEHIDRATLTGTPYDDEYPYAGHVDDPFDATLDLSFDCPREVQWKTQRVAELTDNTVYNKYHSRAIREIVDPGARLVSGYFRLKPTDIFKLSFRKLYYFEKEFYRLNKVIDYDLDEEKLIKCEFIKALDPGAYVPTTRFVIGGKDDTIGGGGTILPPKPPPPNPFENIHNPQENVVTGFNNNVALSSHGVIIVGDDNIVGGSANNVTIVGTNNNVYAGVENVTLINCQDLVIDTSDVLYVNNCLVDGCPATQDTIDGSFDDRSGVASLVDSAINVVNALVTTGSVIIITPIDVFTGALTVTANAGSFDIDADIIGQSGDVNYFIASY